MTTEGRSTNTYIYALLPEALMISNKERQTITTHNWRSLLRLCALTLTLLRLLTFVE